MTDREFLTWIYQRLSYVHGENELVDYMHKLRCIIVSMPADRLTPNDGRGGNGYNDLMKRLDGERVAASMTGIVLELRERALRAEQEGEPLSLLDDRAADEITRLREQPCPYVTGSVTRYCTLTPFTLTDAEREAVEAVLDDPDLVLGDAREPLRGLLADDGSRRNRETDGR